MSLDPKFAAALALHRFGLGPRAGSIAAIASDPRGALLAELDSPNIGRIVHADLMSSPEASRAAFQFRSERQARLILAKREADRLRDMGTAEPEKSISPSDGDGSTVKPEPEPNVEQQIFLKEAKARFSAAIGAEIGFVERLVWFWSNHFCISAVKVPNMAGGYEREAIRPHVLGHFADMLLAAESHPAMLFYLDNSASIGPNSIAGINRSRGLNENLAREILELHTLGVRSGYTQDDVTRFAYVITGWTIIPIQGNPEHGSEFVVNPRMHEPGAQTVVGKSYAEAGVEQGRAVLADLARHPATAEHIATKLVRHFVADQPPPLLVERLMKTFRDTDGHLKEMAKALIAAPEAWSETRSKLKRPSEWRIAGFRAAARDEPDTQRVLRSLALLGEPLWRPSAPQGFPDYEAAWTDGLAMRLDVANAFALRALEHHGERLDPRMLVEEALGPLASTETRETVARAENRAQALALLLMSPEFQRR
jgi:uncharacterized protein (DUF1800 family)